MFLGQPCTVCSHPERAAIDQALVGGVPNLRLAQQYGLSESAVWRHKAEHLPEALAQSGAAKEIARADLLIQQVEGLRNKAVAILLRAEQAGELRTALYAIREARETLALLLEVEGRLDRRPVNILIAPQWLELRAVLIQTLAPYPEARMAVVEALQARDARD
jgi:hypothetical protein